MTAKRDSKSKPKKDERPKVKKEKLKDLDASKEQAGEARGGFREVGTNYCDITKRNCGSL